MKTKSLKVLQDTRHIHHGPCRAGLPKPSTMFPPRLVFGITVDELPKLTFVLPVTFKGDRQNHAQPVKITHL